MSGGVIVALGRQVRNTKLHVCCREQYVQVRTKLSVCRSLRWTIGIAFIRLLSWKTTPQADDTHSFADWHLPRLVYIIRQLNKGRSYEEKAFTPTEPKRLVDQLSDPLLTWKLYRGLKTCTVPGEWGLVHTLHNESIYKRTYNNFSNYRALWLEQSSAECFW